MTAPVERQFATFRRGEVRESILADFRIGLRLLTNPETGFAFSETEIATATADGSVFWIEADAIDLVTLAQQQRALHLADQVRMDRANTSWLTGYHGTLWGEAKLPATGATGPATAAAAVGTVFVGSTTVPDPAAHYAVDPKGLRFQVFIGGTTGGGGNISLTFVGIDTGEQTNIESGTVLTWVNPPLGAQPTASVTTKFTGGTNAETDADFSKRMQARVRHKPAAGNRSHFRSWARDASNAVEDAYVYACAHHAGSVHVAIVQKRSGVAGPLARVPSLGTLASATGYLVPPTSPTVPSRAYVLVTGVTPQSSNAVLQLAMPKGLSSGWADVTPWPGYAAAAAQVVSVGSGTVFRINSDTALPAGVTAPKLMRWNAATSRFEEVLVVSVASVGGGQYDVTHSGSLTIAVGEYISPLTERKTLIAEGIESYFDGLGPGELLDLATDTRAHRAFRFPEPSEEAPYRAGVALVARLADALGTSLSDGALASMSATVPSLPAEVATGPSLLTLGKVAIYSL